jgi:hypothetical protein
LNLPLPLKLSHHLRELAPGMAPEWPKAALKFNPQFNPRTRQPGSRNDLAWESAGIFTPHRNVR